MQLVTNESHESCKMHAQQSSSQLAHCHPTILHPYLSKFLLGYRMRELSSAVGLNDVL